MAVRLISAFIGIALALVVLFLNTTFLFPLAIAGVIAIILTELTQAIGGMQFRLAYAGVLLYGIVTPFLEFYGCQAYMPLAHFICLLLVFVAFIRNSQKFHVEQIAFMLMSAILVTKSLSFVIPIKNVDEHGMVYVVLALCGAWIADSGAYFAGITLGKHKLCPTISPKKTVEGFVGGLVANAVVFALICLGYSLIVKFTGGTVEVNYFAAVVLGAVSAVISVLGDLCASVVKRQKGIKDYGSIMPGHGGMMDRFDSVLFVVPTMYVFLTIFSIFK